MKLEKKSKVKKIVKIIFEVVVIALVFAQYFLQKRAVDVMYLSDFNMVYITICCLVIICAILFLWLDDFLKKNWKERSYYPLVAIVLSIFALYVLFNKSIDF